MSATSQIAGEQLGLFKPKHLAGWCWGKLKPFSFRVIMIDPAWPYANWSEKGEGRNPNQHYPTMSIPQIKALPVSALADKDCALLLWTAGPLADVWPEVMHAWGFKFAGKAFCWAKCWPRACEGPVADICDESNWFMGLGYGTRANTEDCYLGTIGNPVRLDAGVRELIVAPPREHSRKPDEAYARAERLFAGPYVDVFSRETRPSWAATGNEVGKFDRSAA